MQLQPLSLHRSKVRIGEPLPFGILDARGRLLLARGVVIDTEEQLEALLDRGANVDAHDALDPAARVAGARPGELPGLWNDSIDQVSRLLRASVGLEFTAALDRAAAPIIALVERDPNLAILQIVRHEEGGVQQYASRHSVHTAIAASLAARRLGWGEGETRTLFRAALTMNISMVELQNRLSTQVTPLTPMQREQVRSHPERSVQMLEMSGVSDRDWLDAVAQHHEADSEHGYPRRQSPASAIARLVQRADVFTAKFSARAVRPALPPDLAARQMFQADKADPMVAALIKEFGLYPPGSTVRLRSGEVGVVMKRGDGATTPLVMVLANRVGDPLITPLRRDTSQAEHAIAALVPAAALRVRIGLEKLVEAAGS